jgi:hypothetical protein
MSTLRTVVLFLLLTGMAVAQESLPGFLNRPKIEDKLLPKATISKAAGELSFINTTPGFEAIAWRLGSGELKFTKMDKGDIILRHNGKSVRMDASHGIEMGKPAHYEYVKAADDRLGARIHALSQFLVKTDEAVIKGLIDDLLLAEYRKLRALAQRPDAIHAHRDLDLLLFRWMEGPEAYLPTKHNGMLLRDVLEKGLWSEMPGKGRFTRNARLDREFRAFHTKVLIGPDEDESTGTRRNPPLPEWGMR